MLTRKGKESYRLEVVKSLLDFVYIIVFQQNKEAERLLLTKKVLFFRKCKKNSNERRIDKR